jgi:hypothetical protein
MDLMGWNDHVNFVEMYCESCGVTAEWEIWNEVALARYSGKLGEMLGIDAERSGKCPHCGSDDGTEVTDDEFYYPD